MRYVARCPMNSKIKPRPEKLIEGTIIKGTRLGEAPPRFSVTQYREWNTKGLHEVTYEVKCGKVWGKTALQPTRQFWRSRFVRCAHSKLITNQRRGIHFVNNTTAFV